MCDISTQNWTLIGESKRLYGVALKVLIQEMSKSTKKWDNSNVRTSQGRRPIIMEMITVTAVSVWYEGTYPNG
jgi:hypothetical protein